MLDREKIVAVLKRRFPGAAAEQVAAATNAIVGLQDEWIEVAPFGEHTAQLAVPCERSCYLADAGLRGSRFRVFKRAEETAEES